MVITEGNDLEIPKAIENSRQNLTSSQITNVCMPQKLGEVIAQTHFLASAELFRCGINGNVPLQIETKGLLIDKNTDGYRNVITAVNDYIRHPKIIIDEIEYEIRFVLCCDYKVAM